MTSAMQGLSTLYGQTGRRAEWRRLVEEIVPDFVDPGSDGPLPGREEEWSVVTEYRVWLAEEERQWPEAERLQRTSVEWSRQQAAAALSAPPAGLDNSRRHSIRSLAVSLHELGEIQRELGQPDCIESYKESHRLALDINDRSAAGAAAFNIGKAYEHLPAIRDLPEAERWYQRSLKLHAEGDHLGRAKSLGQLGSVARQRFLEARDAGQPEREVLGHLNNAARLYGEALEFTPSNAIGDLAVIHNELGNILADGGKLDDALRHYREAIRYDEMQRNLFGAAQTQYNVAGTLASADRLADAREYALAALRSFETYGDRATQQIQETLQLIAEIEQDLKAQGTGA